MKEDEPRICDRCDEDQPLSEDGKCDICDGYPCDGCGERGGVLNDDMMCGECEPVPQECSECGMEAILDDDGLCPDCLARMNEGDGCENCGDGEGDITDGLCEACFDDQQAGKFDNTPRWIRNVIAERKKKIAEAVRKAVPGGTIDWKKRFGCGHYGCAYAVKEKGHKEPRYVVKLTRDATEGPMQATIARRQKAGEYGFADGFAIVRGVFKVGADVQHMGKTWPVYVVVREEVVPAMTAPLEMIYPKMGFRERSIVASALNNYKDLAAKWYEMKARKKPVQRNLDKIASLMNNALNMISSYAQPLGHVMAVLQSEETPLRDVHANNIGVRHHPGVVDPDDPQNGLGYIVIFDPGHTPYEGDGESQIVQMNPTPGEGGLR